MGRPSYLRDSLAQTGPVPLAVGIFNAEGSTGPTENIAMKAKAMPLRRKNSTAVHAVRICARKFSAGDDDRPAGTMTGSAAKLAAL